MAVRIHAVFALLVLSALSGCTSGDGDKEADLLAADETAVPVLYLNLTVGNQTYSFTTGADGNGTGSGSASTSASAAANATGNSTSAGAGGNGTAGNATGNSTGNATGADGPAGLAPLDVTAQLGASGLPEGAVRWELDFGDGAAGGNATGNATDGGNGTSARRTGGSLPATEDHTYLEPGVYNVTLSVRVANGTAQTLVGAVTVEEDTGATAFGPAPEPIVLEGSITGTFLTEDTNDETFELEAPVASMTLTMEYDTLTGEEDLDWVIVGPGGEEHEGAEGGQEEPVTFEAPTPGTWTITVVGYLALETGYTITVTFE